jgi:FAD/FMN-containing dehydrogenase
MKDGIKGRHLFLLAVFCCIASFKLLAQDRSKVITDFSQLSHIIVDTVIHPKTNYEIIQAVKNHPGPVSIGGGRFSMGGQIATEQALFIDMRGFDRILYFSPQDKEITVQAGITWRKIQEHIDSFNLSVKIMQTYANFTVGGSLSVNCHGRYIGQGPIILSVKSIKIVLANGDTATASPTLNSQIFYGAIGGYGGLGVITEATLFLTDNCKVERQDVVMPISKYKNWFFSSIHDDSSVIFHNADIYPWKYKKVRAVSFRRTQKGVTVNYRLKPVNKKYRFNKFVMKVISEYPGGKWIRQHIVDPVTYRKNVVEWRNFEASYDVMELEPRSKKKKTYVLQEYFVPVRNFDRFYPLMTGILKENKVNVINISIRNARQDPGSMLAWARSEVFAFVLYYKQRTRQKDKDRVVGWTRSLVDAAVMNEGTYYLPYQVNATPEQFARAYPGAPGFFELKKRLDPQNKFRNKLWDAYYKN